MQRTLACMAAACALATGAAHAQNYPAKPIRLVVGFPAGGPADIFGLKDRGRLAVGLPADVVVFDPATVGAGKLERVHDLPAGEDRLISRPRGIAAVIVNGRKLPEPGTVPSAPSGKLLCQRA